MTALVLRGDARNLPLPDASVDLVVTSPPYFGLRSYEDGGEHYDAQVGAEATPQEFVAALLVCTAEMVRVLRPSGSIWVNLGDKYASYEGGRGAGRLQTNDRRPEHPTGTGLAGGGAVRNKSLMGLPWRYALACTDELGLILRAEVVWSKPNGMPESVTDRVRRSHETWFHFTTQPRYYADVDSVREDYAPASLPRRQRQRHRSYDAPGQSEHHGLREQSNAKGSLPGSVRRVPTVPLRAPDSLGVKHYAAFPPEWPRWIINGWCPPGGVVLDPFGGTGTTAMVADVLGRTGITVDHSADYCRLAQWRTADAKERGRVKQPLAGLW